MATELINSTMTLNRVVRLNIVRSYDQAKKKYFWIVPRRCHVYNGSYKMFKCGDMITDPAHAHAHTRTRTLSRGANVQMNAPI